MYNLTAVFPSSYVCVLCVCVPSVLYFILVFSQKRIVLALIVRCNIWAILSSEVSKCDILFEWVRNLLGIVWPLSWCQQPSFHYQILLKLKSPEIDQPWKRLCGTRDVDHSIKFKFPYVLMEYPLTYWCIFRPMLKYYSKKMWVKNMWGVI